MNTLHLPPQQPNLVCRLDDLQSTKDFYINYREPYVNGEIDAMKDRLPHLSLKH